MVLSVLTCLLHPERRHKLHSTRITHAEDIECAYLDRADIGTGVALGIGGDTGQVNARRRGRHNAHGIAESVVREGARQRDVGRSAGHGGSPRPWRVTRGLADAAGNGGCRQQCEIGLDPAAKTDAGDLDRESSSVNDLKIAGERSLHREGEVCGGGVVVQCRDVGTGALRIGAELQNESGGPPSSVRASGAIVRRGVKGNGADGTYIPADVVEPACQEGIRLSRSRAGRRYRARRWHWSWSGCRMHIVGNRAASGEK